MMFKAEVKSLESDDHVMENKSSIDVSRGRDSSTFAEKILALLSQPMVPVPKKATMRVRVATVRVRVATVRVRVAKVRAQCGRHVRDGFEKLELTEQQVEERRHALAQKLIAKTLKQADRRGPRRRRLKILPLCFRRWNICMASFSPLLSSFRWLRHPFLRLARMASLAASRVELWKHHPPSRVTCFPLDDNLLVPLLEGQYTSDSTVGCSHGTGISGRCATVFSSTTAMEVDCEFSQSKSWQQLPARSQLW